MQIGRVSEQTGLSVDAIRFYEKQHIIQQRPRTEGGFLEVERASRAGVSQVVYHLSNDSGGKEAREH
jgi:hypothetical protein